MLVELMAPIYNNLDIFFPLGLYMIISSQTLYFQSVFFITHKYNMQCMVLFLFLLLRYFDILKQEHTL